MPRTKQLRAWDDEALRSRAFAEPNDAGTKWQRVDVAIAMAFARRCNARADKDQRPMPRGIETEDESLGPMRGGKREIRLNSLSRLIIVSDQIASFRSKGALP